MVCGVDEEAASAACAVCVSVNTRHRVTDLSAGLNSRFQGCSKNGLLWPQPIAKSALRMLFRPVPYILDESPGGRPPLSRSEAPLKPNGIPSLEREARRVRNPKETSLGDIEFRLETYNRANPPRKHGEGGSPGSDFSLTFPVLSQFYLTGASC
jgi:hypothetical protein